MARVSLLDHGLAGRTGHHFDLTLNLARRLREAGHRVSVCGHRDPAPEVGAAFAREGFEYHGRFTDPAGVPKALREGAASAWSGRVQRIARELAATPPADLWLFPTLTVDHLAALAALPEPPPVAGLVHEAPDSLGRGAPELWTGACRTLRSRALRVALGAIDPDLADLLRPASAGLDVHTFPVPWEGRPRGAYPARPRRVGFFGHQRRERGLARLPELAASLLRGGFEVLLHDSRGRIPRAAGASRLQVLNGFLEDLDAAVGTCDLLVCPMDPVRYRMRLSGIVLQAVASGIPFVVPEGTLSCRRFAPTGCCRAYAGGGPAEALGAIEALAEDYPRYSRASASLAQRWAETQGEVRFLEACRAALRLSS